MITVTKHKLKCTVIFRVTITNNIMTKLTRNQLNYVCTTKTQLKMLSKNQNKTKEKNLKRAKRFLTLRILYPNKGHMIFIMLKKKSLTTHLLLTNPTAVFLNNDRSCICYTSVSGFSLCLLVLCKACGPDINVFTSCSLPFTGFQSFGQTFVFLGKFK